MKKYCILLCIALVPLLASARTRSYSRSNTQADNYHFGYISAAAGYTSISQNIDNVHTTGDLGYLVGLGYEFRRNSFWLSVGAQYMQEKSKTEIDEFSFIPSFKGLDDQGRNVDYYRYTIRQTDQQAWQTIDVPILLGYYYNGFYCGAGAKVGFSMSSSITTGGNYDLSAQYERYIGEFRQVNYYTNYPIDNRRFDCNLRPQFSLLGEIGYDLLSPMNTNSRICNVLKLGFYFEYGLRSVRPQNTLDIVSIGGKTVEEAARTGADVREATINPFYMSTATEGKWVVPYFVGVKLTYMIGGNRYATGTWHKGCMCYQ
ncbi:MAG: hypothetical protein MJZ65_06570 [Paludibacteraceae bacterium]|nr:hypothetical protein [Paludibacteraceae bacterium]